MPDANQTAGQDVKQESAQELMGGNGQPPLTLGKWNVIGKIRPAQRLDEEKTQSGSAAFDGSW